jgi:hypothetical protein
MIADFHLKGHDIYTNKVREHMNKLLGRSQGNIEMAYDLLTEYTTTIKKTIEANRNLTLGEIANLIP